MQVPTDYVSRIAARGTSASSRKFIREGKRKGVPMLDDSSPVLEGLELTEAISAAMVGLYADFYNHERTTATTYINDNVVVCILEDILSVGEDDQIASGGSDDVIDGRVAFQNEAEDEFKAAIERLTQRRVTAFLSANQTAPGVACELFFLDSPAESAGAR